MQLKIKIFGRRENYIWEKGSAIVVMCSLYIDLCSKQMINALKNDRFLTKISNVCKLNYDKAFDQAKIIGSKTKWVMESFKEFSLARWENNKQVTYVSKLFYSVFLFDGQASFCSHFFQKLYSLFVFRSFGRREITVPSKMRL